MWNGYLHGEDYFFDERDLWKSTIRAQQHMNGHDVINTLTGNNGSWIQGREKQKGPALIHQGVHKEIKEHQYYIANNKDNANGYLYNRKYNLYMAWQQNDGPTAPENNTCIVGLEDSWPSYSDRYLYESPNVPIYWDEKKMKIEGLHKKQWYTIDYFSVLDGGSYEYSKCVKTNKRGELELEHYPSSISNPIYWYNVYRSSCNSRSVDLEKSKNTNRLNTLDLTIHPNPSNGEFELRFETPIDDNYNVTIINVFGQEIISKTYEGKSCKINLSNQAKGLYFVKIYTPKFETVKKIIIE